MDNIHELQVDQIVQVHDGRAYDDAIITNIDYEHDEIEVQLAEPRGYRMVGVADVEVPR